MTFPVQTVDDPWEALSSGSSSPAGDSRHSSVAPKHHGAPKLAAQRSTRETHTAESSARDRRPVRNKNPDFKATRTQHFPLTSQQRSKKATSGIDQDVKLLALTSRHDGSANQHSCPNTTSRRRAASQQGLRGIPSFSPYPLNTQCMLCTTFFFHLS